MGWCTESMHQMLQAASAAMAIRKLLEAYLRGDLTAPATNLLNMALPIPFSSASRQSTLAALYDCAPELAMSQQSWLCALGGGIG
eukprot:1901829-Amphidinium_carterae.6